MPLHRPLLFPLSPEVSFFISLSLKFLTERFFIGAVHLVVELRVRALAGGAAIRAAAIHPRRGGGGREGEGDAETL